MFKEFLQWVRNKIMPFLILLFLVVLVALFPPSQELQQRQIAAQPISNSSCNTLKTVETTRDATYLVITPSGHASGFGIDASGLIATNNHVVEGESNFKVRIGGTLVDATLWNSAPNNDLAVLKVDTTIKTVDWYPSGKLNVAENLYAIGWGADLSGDEPAVTEGILSRDLTVGDGVKVIQTDAPINPGNSGGPLINACGVVGIDTAKLVWVDQQVPAEGIGYALASDWARPILSSLANKQSTHSPLLDTILQGLNLP